MFRSIFSNMLCFGNTEKKNKKNNRFTSFIEICSMLIVNE